MNFFHFMSPTFKTARLGKAAHISVDNSQVLQLDNDFARAVRQIQVGVWQVLVPKRLKRGL